MKLSQWAKEHDIAYRTARRHFDKGLIPGAYRFSERIIIVPDTQESSNEVKHVAIYARVSSHDQKNDLKRQSERLKDFATANGWVVDTVVEEVASGMNPRRRKLATLLSNKNISTILVENKDRLARMNAELIESAYPGEIIVSTEIEPEYNDIQDIIDFMTSFCARQYGRRSAKNKAKRISDNIMNSKENNIVPDS